MHRGYVKFYRRALENGWLKDHPVWVLMSYCLLRANHAAAPDVCRGSKISLNPGQFIFGRDSASRETGLSPQQIRTALYKLHAYKFLTIRATKRFSVVTICNWAIYQSEDKPEQPTEQPTGNQQVTNRQPTDNHKQECKNENIKKEEIGQQQFLPGLDQGRSTKKKQLQPPTIEEVKEYAVSRNHPEIAERFFDYYTAGDWFDKDGKKLRSWKQKFITWEKGSTGRQNNNSSNYSQTANVNDVTQAERDEDDETWSLPWMQTNLK